MPCAFTFRDAAILLTLYAVAAWLYAPTLGAITAHVQETRATAEAVAQVRSEYESVNLDYDELMNRWTVQQQKP